MEVRENLVKSAKAVCEEAKVGIRRARQKGMNDVRKQKKAMSQDDARMVENYVSLSWSSFTKNSYQVAITNKLLDSYVIWYSCIFVKPMKRKS